MAAENLVGDISTSEQPSAIAARLSRALGHDALSGFAWFNLGVWHTERQELREASDAYTFCALCQPADREAWTNAIVLGFAGTDANVGVDVVHTAQRFVGTSELVSQLRDWVDRQGSEFDRGLLFEGLERVLAAVPSDERGSYTLTQPNR